RGVHGRRGARRAVPLLRLRAPPRAGLRRARRDPARRAPGRAVRELREAEAGAASPRDPARQAGALGGGTAPAGVLPRDQGADEGEPQALASGPVIALAPYDPEWACRFEAERTLLERVLAPWLEGGVEHVGSTAI